MPIMRITYAKTWKHLSSRDWLSLEQLSEEFWFEFPTEPSFKVVDAKKKNEKKEETETVAEEKPAKKKKTKRL